MFEHVMGRRSCKEPFTEQVVTEDVAQSLSSLATIVTKTEKVEAIKELTWQAWMTETTTPRTMKESVDLMRMGKNEINANPDGIDLGGFFLESLMVFGLLTHEQMLNPNSSSFKHGVTEYEKMLKATPAYAVINTNANDRAAQINAGRQWLKLNLTTTSLGLSLHPVSQALQEFDEMADHYKHAHTLLAEPGQTVQMLGRLGYGPQTGQSPRWPLQTRIMHSAGS